MSIFLLILLTAAITYLLRALPLVVFRKPLENPFFTAFIDALPYALLAAMILPDIFFAVGDAKFPEMPSLPSVTGAITALILGLCKKSLPTVALSAAAIAYVFS